MNKTIVIPVRVSYSGLPTQNFFEIISNDIPFVNISPLFSPTITFEFKILNNHCVAIFSQIAAG